MNLRDEIVRLREQGMSIRSIQQCLGISTPSLVQYHLTKAQVAPFNKKELEKRVLVLERENKYLKKQLRKIAKINLESRRIL